MLFSVLAFATLIPLVGAWRASVSRRGVVITHVTLFSFGALFYWISPILLGESRLLANDSALDGWYSFFEAHASRTHVMIYLVAVTGFYLAFCAGSWLGARVRLPALASNVLRFDRRLLALVFPFAIAIMATYAFLLRGQFFNGYADLASGNGGPRGTFTASVMLLLDLALLNIAMRSPRRPSAPWWRNGYVAAVAIGMALLLSLGGRLYVASAVLMGLVYATLCGKPLRRKTVLLGTVIGVLAIGLTGVLRVGRQFSANGLIVNIAGEPLFTSFSLIQFLSRPHFEWWNLPRFLLGDLINLVPTAIFPGKAAYRLDPAAFGYVVFSPLGALNSFFSWSINFGILGSLVPLFLLGFGLAILRRHPAPLVRVIYSILSAWLAFTFFRDPFSVSLVKNMLEFGVVIPIGLAACLHMLTVAVGARSRAPLNPQLR